MPLPRSLRAPEAAETAIEQRILLTATLCLLAFGAVMVYSASSASGVLQGGSGSSYLIKFVLYGALGLVVMRVFARRGIELVQRVVGPLLAISFVLLLAVHVPGIGVSVNGARRWIGRGPLVFEPSELMKIAILLYSATLLARRPQQVHDFKELRKPLLLVAGAACAFVASEDIGTAMVLAFTVLALLVSAGISMRKLGIIVGTLVLVVGIYALARPYARARLTSFINPWAHPYGSGFQAVQGQVAIGSGGLFGVGPGGSVRKIFYLGPEAPTDMILAVIGEELGVVGICVLLSLYGAISYAGLRIAKRARSLHSALIAVGVTSLIVAQAMLNVFSVLGLAPLTGVPLPFVSYGASSMLVMFCSMGLLMNVAAGGSVHVRAVPDRRGRSRPARPASAHGASASGAPIPALAGDARARETARWWDEQSFGQADRDRGRGHRGTRGARARGR